MNPIISIKNLSFKYPDGSFALEGINLEINEEESVGIIGPNGAGKSTLLLHLNGTLTNKPGVIEIQNIPVNSNTLKTIRKKVGVVFQDPDDQLFMPTVFDDIAFGLLNLGFKEEAIKQRVKNILSQLNLIGYEKRSPHHLSLGEKKKISLAGILVLEPSILVLDEPTANLDPSSQNDFISILKGIKATKIITSHDLDVINAVTNKVILLNKGKKVVEGETKSIIHNLALMEENGLLKHIA